jgi:hypothetical protein
MNQQPTCRGTWFYYLSLRKPNRCEEMKSHVDEVAMTPMDRYALPNYYLCNGGRVYSGVCQVGAIKGQYAPEKCSKINLG